MYGITPIVISDTQLTKLWSADSHKNDERIYEYMNKNKYYFIKLISNVFNINFYIFFNFAKSLKLRWADSQMMNKNNKKIISIIKLIIINY